MQDQKSAAQRLGDLRKRNIAIDRLLTEQFKGLKEHTEACILTNEIKNAQLKGNEVGEHYENRPALEYEQVVGSRERTPEPHSHENLGEMSDDILFNKLALAALQYDIPE